LFLKILKVSREGDILSFEFFVFILQFFYCPMVLVLDVEGVEWELRGFNCPRVWDHIRSDEVVTEHVCHALVEHLVFQVQFLKQRRRSYQETTGFWNLIHLLTQG